MSSEKSISLVRDCKTKTSLGLLIACSIITIWASSLAILFTLDTFKTNNLLILFAILWQTFFYTGLFITAHDAMHGVVFSRNSEVNNFIGFFALIFYGLFSYRKMIDTHWQHHQHPASELDPDYHNGEHKGFLSWYLYFMFRYWSWLRLIGLVVAFHFMSSILNTPKINLILFWIVPSLLSSIQLFYFGTFLPHREPLKGYQNSLRAQSVYLPMFWSFLTCYHFLYHQEHHEYPHIPWWQLPKIVR